VPSPPVALAELDPAGRGDVVVVVEGEEKGPSGRDGGAVAARPGGARRPRGVGTVGVEVVALTVAGRVTIASKHAPSPPGGPMGASSVTLPEGRRNLRQSAWGRLPPRRRAMGKRGAEWVGVCLARGEPGEE
jgi:hypothetical protein